MQISNLKHLEILSLSHNKLQGGIPLEIGELKKLKILSLKGNFLTGGFIKELGQLKSLENLNLDSNRLSGSLPPEIGKLTSLKTLEISENIFSCQIPPEIGNLKGLTWLRANTNYFSGCLPKSMGNLKNLETLYLFGNEFSGSIPAEFGNLKNLKIFWLGNSIYNQNKIEGNIPKEFKKLQNLEELHLKCCVLEGDIGFLSSLDKLRMLRLDNGKFTFADLESFAKYCDQSFRKSHGFSYSPQAKVHKPESYKLKVGEKLNLIGKTEGERNKYQWYKDGKAIPGARSLVYIIEKVKKSDSGTYVCKIKNTLLDRVTISTYDKVVVVN